MEETQASKPPAPAIFIGTQRIGPPIDLYNLTEDIPGHCKHSTVSRETLEKAGFSVPPAPQEQ